MAKLDHAACMQANQDFWGRHPELGRRQLTMTPEDAPYRQEWMQLYQGHAQQTPKPTAPRTTPDTSVLLPAPERPAAMTLCPDVASMTHEQKIEQAIQRSSIWPALKDEVDLPVMAATMVATMGGLALLAATGYGAVAEAVGAGLLVVGGLKAGYQIGGGLMDLFEFFQLTRCDVARTTEDLDAAGKKFASGVAKTGVGGLFLLLGMKGAQGRTLTGKPITPGAKLSYSLTRGKDTGQPIKFGQKGVSPEFGSKGRFGGASIDEVVAKLKSGELSPDDVPVQYIWVNGEKVVVNNRSLTALSKAGMKPTNTIDMTGKLPEAGPDSLPSVLGRLDEMGGKPSASIPIRENSDWNSPASEIVRLPND